MGNAPAAAGLCQLFMLVLHSWHMTGAYALPQYLTRHAKYPEEASITQGSLAWFPPTLRCISPPLGEVGGNPKPKTQNQVHYGLIEGGESTGAIYGFAPAGLDGDVTALTPAST